MSMSPFPGFNPWFETVWGTAHHFLIAHAHSQIRQQLPPPYKARINQDILIERADGSRRVYPDVHVAGASPTGPEPMRIPTTSTAEPELILLDEVQPQPFIEIVDGSTGDQVVTVIEVLSPTNKLDGQALYRAKQSDLRSGGVNLVEIDWVRSGRPTTLAALQRGSGLTGSTPHVSIFRSSHPATAELYRISLRGPLPTIRVPLTPTENCVLSLSQLNDAVAASLDLRGDEYAKPLEPPLSEEDANWATVRIRDWLQLS